MTKNNVKFLTQADLDKMSPPEVLNIDVNLIPEGFDVSFDEDGSNPVLYKLADMENEYEEVIEEEFIKTSTKDLEKEETTEEIDENSKPTPKVQEAKADEKPDEKYSKEREERYQAYRKLTPDERFEKTRGTLFLRFFSEDPTNGKILTRLRGVVYFPQSNIIEGWYVACVVSERKNHGIMDTIPLQDVDVALWRAHSIKGAHTDIDYANNCLDIYPAKPKDQLKNERSVKIHSVSLPVAKASVSIKDILSEKQSEALEKLGK